MPLKGKRVLVTRPDGESLANLLRERGADVEAIPAIRFAPPDDPQPALRAMHALEKYAWCVLASSQAAESFFNCVELEGVAVPHALQFAAVGPATSVAVERHGARVAVMPQTFNGAEVANALAGVAQTADRVLLFRAQEGGDEIARVLSARGFEVEAVAGYQTLAALDQRARAAAENCDVWTFASGSAVRGLAANVDAIASLARAKTIACIGEKCAAAARELGLHVDVTPHAATAAALVEALEAHLASA
jgi:uroporphyrinogen-III synthase